VAFRSNCCYSGSVQPEGEIHDLDLTDAVESPGYRTIDDKVENIERYLIEQVDAIRRYVIIAIALSALGAAAAILSIWVATRAPAASPLAQRRPNAGTIKQAYAADRAPAARVAEATEATAVDTQPPVAAARAGPRVVDAAHEVARANAAGKELAAHRPERPPAEATLPPGPATPTALPNEPPPSEEPPSPINSAAPPEAAATRSPGPTAPRGELPTASPGDSYFRVGESAIATKIVNLAPVGTGRRFPARKGTLYCWTRILTDSLTEVPRERRVIVHRWIRGDEVVRERSFAIASPRYRVYSALSKVESGDWRVDIVEADGTVIGTEKFVVE